MMKSIRNSFQFYKGLQEWFDPAFEENPYIRKRDKNVRVRITLNGIATKTVCIVR